MIVMGVGEDHVGHVTRRNAGRLELGLQWPANAEGADVDQNGVPVGTQQRDGAPAEPAMAHRLARKSLHEDVDPIHLLARFFYSARIFAASATLPNFSLSDRTKWRSAASVIGRGTMPWIESFSIVALSCSAAEITSNRCVCSGSGVADGANTPNQFKSS